MEPKNVTALTVNWLTARRTRGAVESFLNLYKDVQVLIVDDGSNPDDKPEFDSAYRHPENRAELIYDPYTEQNLRYIPRTELWMKPNHSRHGESIDYILPTISTKWIFHFDSDIRFIKPGVIEYMLEGVDEDVCGIGIEKVQNPAFPKIANYVAMFRADLAKKYPEAVFTPDYPRGLETGTRYFAELRKYGYKIKFVPDLPQYYVHLRYSEEKKDEWNRYF